MSSQVDSWLSSCWHLLLNSGVDDPKFFLARATCAVREAPSGRGASGFPGAADFWSTAVVVVDIVAAVEAEAGVDVEVGGFVVGGGWFSSATPGSEIGPLICVAVHEGC